MNNKRSNIRLAVGGTTVFKFFLLFGIAVISVVFIWYTLDVIDQLKKDAERMVTSYVRLWQLAASENSSGGEVQVIFEEVIKKANFPVIIASSEREPIFWRNVPGIVDNDPSAEAKVKVTELAEEMREDKGEIPLKYAGKTISYFYYGDSKVIRELQWMPFVEIGLVGAFILVGFIGFQNIRRSEERHIWVGMAKETAHQLGTPISSLLGWLEIFQSGSTDSASGSGQNGITDEEMLAQMKTDVTRLRRVANRFGQIGAKPDLNETDIDNLIEETVAYFRRRLPFDGKGVDIIYNRGSLGPVSINGELFTWAIENLVKNSLQVVDAKRGQVELSAYTADDSHYVVIEVKDNGPGIPAGVARKVFRPGFTTKKRGWGLGLTLARRIIEEYHRGRISLVKSKPGETIFQIVLPVKGTKKVKRFRPMP
ncbi:MAG: HAMP domain-containing histidine kinase [Candidatus Zixiibacteriota bacterium]|nr:MAG: HAMP domain-containing histidine kinase [candidate division Zixibacteria bacterium]